LVFLRTYGAHFLAISGGVAAAQGNTSLGTFALQNNTTGDFNTASGRQALFSNTTGIANTGIGLNALF
jgi:trimeric autotransporter adhesin